MKGNGVPVLGYGKDGYADEEEGEEGTRTQLNQGKCTLG